MKPTLIDYRNVKYQGFIRELQPEGVGLGLDERMHFIASNWHEGMMDGRSVVFYGHCKYNYGEWRQGLPHGLNVFRMGDTIVFACYDKGVIIGEFLVIFYEQKLALRVELRGNSLEIRERRTEQHSKQDLQYMIDKANFPQPMSEEYYELISFIATSFSREEARRYLKFEEDANNNFLGYPDGLGIIFDNDNFIRTVGVLNDKLQPKEVGGKFNATLNEEGNFYTAEVVKYTSRQKRPMEHVTKIFRKSQVKSMTYYNSYINVDVHKPLLELEAVLKNKLMAQVAQQQLYDTQGINPADLNDSLEYQPRTKNDGDRLRRIREELYHSIRRPGAEVVVSPKKKPEYRPNAEVITETSPYRPLTQKENVHHRPVSKFQQPLLEPVPTIGINRNELLNENRIQDYIADNVTGQIIEGQIKYDNIQERRERLLNDYRNLRVDNYHIAPPPVARAAYLTGYPKHDSPGRRLNMLDTDREILNAMGSSRHLVPVLHEQPPAMYLPNKTSSPNKRKPEIVDPRSAKRTSTYRDIYLKQQEHAAIKEIKEERSYAIPSTPTRERIPLYTNEGANKYVHPSPVTAAHHGARDKSSSKKYNYLDGIDH